MVVASPCIPGELRTDEKVFVECNIQKESEAEPRGKRAFKVVLMKSEKSKVKSETDFVI